MSSYIEGFEDGVRATKAEYLKLLKEESHPVKEQDTECQYCKQGCIRCDARKQLTDEEIWHIQAQCHLKNVGYDNFIMRFARAILRKAQEPLSEKFEKVLNDNLWEMLEEDGEAQEK